MTKYRRIMIIVSLSYGAFFAFLSQIFVYRPDVMFSNQGIIVPSYSIITCCNIIGYVPMFTAYVTEHFLIFIIPVNFVLAILVSSLVGFNTSLSIYALSKGLKKGAKKNRLINVVGAAGGLFVGCPTCAGSLLSASIGLGTVSSLSFLASMQSVFIAISIPALVVSPFIIARQIKFLSDCRIN